MRNYSSTAAETSLSSGITGLSTTMQVVSTSGFPVSTPYTLVIDPGKPEEEIVDVTAVSGLTLTITRAVDGTSATAHSVGAVVRHMATARDFRESQEHIAAGSNVHGVSGSVVGTTSAQSLSNKTLDSPTLSGTVSNTGTVSGGTVNPTTLQQGGVQAVTVSGLQTLTDKTLSSPIVSGTLTTSGDVTLDGSVVGGSLNPSTLQRGGVDAVVVTGAQTLSGKTLDNPTLLGAITTQSLSAYPLIVCTSTTRPASPATGMEIFETDTGRKYVWTGVKWLFVGGVYPAVSVRRATDGPTWNPAGVWKGIDWSATLANETTDSSMWSSGQPTRLVAPIDGLYLVVGQAGLDLANTGGNWYLSVFRASDGAYFRGTSLNRPTNTPGEAHVVAEVFLAANDYVEIRGYSDVLNSFVDGRGSAGEVSPRASMRLITAKL